MNKLDNVVLAAAVEVGEQYQYLVDLIEVDKLLVSVFNITTGYTFVTYIQKDDAWYKEHIYSFRGEIRELQTILTNCFISRKPELKHTVVEDKDSLRVTITYSACMFPFEMTLNLNKRISAHNPLEDRVNSLEYQVKRLQARLSEASSNAVSEAGSNAVSEAGSNAVSEVIEESVSEPTGELVNALGHRIYKGELLQGKAHGQGIRYCDNREIIIYEGGFKNGLYDGQGTLYHIPNIQVAEGKGRHLDGIIKEEGGFKQGFRHGLVHTHHKDYIYMSAHYDMGLYHGLVTTYATPPSTEPKQSEHHYKHGVLHGTCTVYCNTGKEPTVTEYVEGVCITSQPRQLPRGRH
jgi:hypothetical protein